MKRKYLSLVSAFALLVLFFWIGGVSAKDTGVYGNNGAGLATCYLNELPFGLSNPYDKKDYEAKDALPGILKDLGLSEESGTAGFVVDIIGRKKIEASCNAAACQKYDFSSVKELIDLVVGESRANLWIVIGSPSNYKFIDGKERKNENTYLPDGPISRQAYKDYLVALVNFVNSYGRQVSGNPNWYVVRWNLYNEVNAEYRDTFDKDVGRAAAAYVNFVIDSAEVLRGLSPQSKIVLAGAGSATDLEGNHGEFYRLVFSKLKQANLAYEPFDYWESHWFGEFKDYGKNEAGYSAKDFIDFLNKEGYGDKEFLIRAGATYSGQDLGERKHLMDNYQSEEEQAQFLVKRFVYNLANGAKKIPWSTVFEHEKYKGSLHSHFNYTGLLYNGVPDGISKNQRCSSGWLPCPDPGKGVKKLAYYSFKKLIEELKGSDFDKIEAVKGGEGDNLYLYKFLRNGKEVYVAWWDYFNDAGYREGATKEIVINNISARTAEITEAIPKYTFGHEVRDYSIAFNSYPLAAIAGDIAVNLGKKPVFIEFDASTCN